MMKTKILYVEDEASIARIVSDTLKNNGYEVKHVLDGKHAMSAYKTMQPDICILDVMLPSISGFQIAEKIRTMDQHTPILFLTAKDSTEDLVKGFESGGKDYIKKPFSLEELKVRIKNLLELSDRKIKRQEILPTITIRPGVTFDQAAMTLKISDKERKMSYKEACVLAKLIQHKNRVLKRKDLLMAVWNDDSFFNSRTLDVYITKLRKYFENEDIQIITLRGVGYHFFVPEG